MSYRAKNILDLLVGCCSNIVLWTIVLIGLGVCVVVPLVALALGE